MLHFVVEAQEAAAYNQTHVAADVGHEAVPVVYVVLLLLGVRALADGDENVQRVETPMRVYTDVVHLLISLRLLNNIMSICKCYFKLVFLTGR